MKYATFPVASVCTLAFLASAQVVPRQVDVDFERVLTGMQSTPGARVGERFVQDFQVRVTRRNNRRPVAAGLLVRARTPRSGPTATFGRGNVHEAEFRTDANGQVTISGLLANSIAGPFQLELEIDFTDQTGVRWFGREAFELRNLKGGGWGLPKKIAVISAVVGGGALAACFAGPCRSDGRIDPPSGVVSFGSPRVGPFQ
ncbi:MAG: hypothetical protein JNN08_10595 [Bryobacterales bacterium]|nr:hypothetical protein [Bryobacterales bacterium]